MVALRYQEAALRAKMQSRDEANRAAGVLGSDGSDRRRQQSYAQELEQQMRMKKVVWQWDHLMIIECVASRDVYV